MAAVLGLDAKLYRNTGSHVSPTWNEVPNVKDLTTKVEKAEADVSRRATSFKLRKGALKDASIDFEMVWDTSDPDFTAIKDAFFKDQSIEFAAMDGPIGTTGAQGLRATMEVFTFERAEPLTEALSVKISLKPTDSVHYPEWYEVGVSTS